jgi:hypothetical protein
MFGEGVESVKPKTDTAGELPFSCIFERAVEPVSFATTLTVKTPGVLKV